MQTYLQFLPKVKNILAENNIVNKSDFSSDRAYDNTLNAKTFDILRYLLPTNVSTSL
jgi:hypothetical protein